MNKINRIIAILIFAAMGCGPAKTNSNVVHDSSQSAPVTTSPSTDSNTEKIASTVNVNADTAWNAEPKLRNTDTVLVATADAGTAEATFQQVLIAFQDGRLEIVYDFLPRSFQTDVDELVHEFAKKMDVEVWAGAFGAIDRVAVVMKEKKTLILDFDGLKRASIYDSVKTHWDNVVSGIQEIASSDINNLKTLERADVRRLLTSMSRVFQRMPLPKFGNVTVHTVNSNDEMAILSYRESQNGEPKQVEFVKVEGKWLSKSIATGWSQGIRDLKARLSDFPERISLNKSKVIQHLDGIHGILNEINESKNQNELSVALEKFKFSISLAALMAQEALFDAAMIPRKGNHVRVEINREISVKEQSELKEVILASLKETSVDYELMTSEGKTRCRFTPVLESEPLVEVLRKHYRQADVRLDIAKKTIYVEMK